LGIFSCRGELSEKTAINMSESSNEKLREFAKMRVKTIGYPTINDLNNAQMYAQSILSDTSN